MGLIPKDQPLENISLDSFTVDNSLRSKLDSICYKIQPDFSNMTNPYLKIDWILYGQDQVLYLNDCVSWRSIAFVVNKKKGKTLYLRFHPLTHALLASQI